MKYAKYLSPDRNVILNVIVLNSRILQFLRKTTQIKLCTSINRIAVPDIYNVNNSDTMR